MKLSHLLDLSAFHFRPVTGVSLDQDIRWVAVIDIPNAWNWIQEGQLLLTTGYTWPHDPEELQVFIARIAERRPVGIALAVPHFFEQFPEAAREEAERQGLAAFELPWEIPFGVLTEAIHKELLREHYVLLERSEQIHRALTQAVATLAGFRELARVLADLLDREVIFVGSGGEVLGAHPAVQPFLLPEFAYSLKGAVLKKEGVVSPIRVGEQLSGWVVVRGGKTPLSELDVRAAEHASVVAALQIVHERALSLQEARLGYAFFESLLDASESMSSQVIERAARLGFKKDLRFRLGAVQLHTPVPLSEAAFKAREALASDLRDALKSCSAPQLLSLQQNHVIFVLPEDHAPVQLWSRIRRPGCSMAFSRLYQGLSEVGLAYQDLQMMLPHSKEGQLHHYDDLLIPRVLAGDREARTAFLDDLFSRLPREDLRGTLMAFVQCGFQLKKTAMKLQVHINTLRYRLERISEATGWDLEDVQTRFKLQLADHLLLENHKK
ncbi:PucR family transcriptional regulator [Deinococcus cellulosilyticus]|uniref:Transcriptional regulator n=1 Tax=Deinococcus cellulosilyticus (strain DSM 18568 / NBRC 106333 / KACC 11606 / 5516J-15) TaxID=1223518 RepID=A0A511N5V0_DEIC1|nr:PucR family transcriptional regulator [Deinococcus cellulosilyticus]GEM48235.1 transcriptional regulator [Deinococcus cellulosilyticus NBRC 106333 = KACC 11606]